MGNKVYVGNLSWGIGDNELKKAFAEFGEVTEARVIIDRMTRRSKGFGFVTFATDEEAQKAVSAMDGKEVEGRALKVNEAREMEPRG